MSRGRLSLTSQAISHMVDVSLMTGIGDVYTHYLTDSTLRTLYSRDMYTLTTGSVCDVIAVIGLSKRYNPQDFKLCTHKYKVLYNL